MKSTKNNTKAAKKKANASQCKNPLRQKRRSRSKDSDRGVPSVIEVTTKENIKPLTYKEQEDKSTKPVESKFAAGTRMAKYSRGYQRGVSFDYLPRRQQKR